MTKKILITDCDFGDGSIERGVVGEFGYSLDIRQLHNEQEIIDAAQGSAGLLVQYAPISELVISESPSLKAVVRYGVGLDTIDLDAAERAQVAVRGINDYCIDEVADHCLALLLALTRSIRECDSAIKKGAWPPPHDFPALEPLGGKTIGLIGFGQIARAVARRLQAFGCRVCAHDPNVNSTVLDEHGVESVSFEEVLNSDVISLHVPAQPGSASLLSVREFARVKPGAILLNVSRGSLIDEEALVTALDSGAIAAAGLDVFVQESGNASKLALHPRVVATPHVAYYSPASLIKLRRRAAEVLVAELEKVE